MSRRRKRFFIIMGGFIFLLIDAPDNTRGFILFSPLIALFYIANYFQPLCVYSDPAIRLASPDRQLEVVVWHTDCGATTGVMFTTYLKRFGKEHELNTWVFYSEYTVICGLYWQTPKHLVMEIAYGKKFTGLRTTIPLSDLYEEDEEGGKDPGSVEFELRKVPYNDRCTMGLYWSGAEEMARDFMSTPGFPMYPDEDYLHLPEPQIWKKKKKSPKVAPAPNPAQITQTSDAVKSP